MRFLVPQPFGKSAVIPCAVNECKVLVEGEGLKKVIELTLDAKVIDFILSNK